MRPTSYLLALANDGLLDWEANRDIVLGYQRLIGGHVANDTGQFGSITDEPAWWSATPWYRIVDGSEGRGFFRAKQRNLRERLLPDTTLDGGRLVVRGLDGWGADDAYRLQGTGDEHLYAITLDLDAGDYSFKIADADWSAETDFGAYPGAESLTLSIPCGMAQRARVSGVRNMRVKIPEDGRYAFTLDTLDADRPYLTIKREARRCEPDCKEARFKQVCFRGTPNGWGTTAMDLVEDHLWRTQATFPATGDRPNRFKLDINGDWTFNFGDSDQTCRADPVCEGTALTRADNGGRSVGDIFVDRPGTYVINFNDQTCGYRFGRIGD